jgi:hypothetical protein
MIAKGCSGNEFVLRVCGAISVTVLAVVCLVSCSSGNRKTTIVTPPPAAAMGGSNYGWYYLGTNCNREPYGVVYNYDAQATTIDAQLQQMYANGQRRLRIPIYFERGINSGTIMDSTGGTLAPAFLKNLADLLAAVKAAGFVEIEVSFNPQGNNNPTQWGATFSSDYYDENWSVLQNVRAIVVASGIPYHLDLLNEGIPPPSGYEAMRKYCQKLWNDYVSKFGSTDTMGFSIIADQAHASQVSTVYGDTAYGNHGAPALFDVHIYDDTGSSFTTAYNALVAQGYQGIPWIIGEGYYNDAAEAAAQRQAATSTGQKVLYLTEWPLSSGAACSPDVNVAPPANFANYQAQGF